MGSLFKPNTGNPDMTLHHNLWAHNNNRNPAIGSYNPDQHVRADIRNNVVYNCPNTGYTSGEGDRTEVNYVGNYSIFGPDSNEDAIFEPRADNDVRIYQSGNMRDLDRDGRFDGRDDGWAMFEGDYDTRSSPFTFQPMTTESAEDALEHVLLYAGARPWNRDIVDERVVDDVRNQTGSLIDSVDETPGYGDLDRGATVVDTDRDGMPDAWERQYGTNPGSADNNGDLDDDGYTNLENYLHWAARLGQ